MAILAVTRAADVPSETASSLANDGGICISDKMPAGTKIPPKQIDPATGLIVSLAIADQYFHPDPAHATTITTPGGQKITVFADIVSCSETSTVKKSKLINDTLINGLWFMAGKTVIFHDTLAFASGVIRDDTEVFDDILLKSHSQVTFYNDETREDKQHLESGVIRDSEKFYDINFPAGTRVWFHQNGKFHKATLSQNTDINGVTFAANHEVEFDEDGHFIRGTLAFSKNIYSVTWPAFQEVTFHPNQKFKGGTLALMTRIKTPLYSEITFIPGTRLEYHDNGVLAKGTPLKDFHLTKSNTDFWLRGAQEIEFYPDGSIKNGLLRDPTSFDNVSFAAGPISFYPNGVVEKAILGEDIEFPWIRFPVTFVKGCEVEFDESGRFHGGDPKEDVVLNDYRDDTGNPIVLKANAWLSVHSDGTFRNGRLKKEIVIEGLPLTQNSKIYFDEDKKFKKGTLTRDTEIFPDIYGDKIVFSGGTECGYNDKNEFYGTLKNDVSFVLEIPGKKITLTATAGKELRFVHDTQRIQGGFLKTDVTPWPGVTFTAGEWFKIDMNHSDYFTPDENKEEPEYLGGVLKNGLSRDGHDLPAGRYCEFYLDGSIRGYRVEKPFEVDPDFYPGLILGDDRWVEFYPGGTQIKGGKLAGNAEPFPDIYDDPDNPLVFSEDTWIAFNKDGFLTGGKLVQDFVMEHPLFGDLFLQKGEWVDVTPEGVILGGHLAKDTELFLPGFDNLILAQGEWVDFDENGNFVGGKLAEEATYYHPIYGVIHFEASTRIEFNPDSMLVGGILAKPLSIPNSRYGPIDLMAEEWFELHPTGEFKSGTLANEVYIINDKTGNFYIVDGAEAEFYRMENLHYGTLADEMELNTPVGLLDFEEFSEIEIGEEDEIMSGYVAKKYAIGGDSYRVGDWVDITQYVPEGHE